jgi:hypothetical protein
MERLTGRDADGGIVANEEMQIIASRGTTNDDLHNIINHLAEKLCEYEDLEESGNLLRSPCRLGDTVYILNQKRIIPLKICEIYFDSHGIEMAAKNREELGYRTINLTEDGIGVEWYKTEEEAKAAMNKLKGIDNKGIERD